MADTNLKKNKQGYGYKYVELSAIHNYLEENNAKYIQKIERIDTDDYIMTKRCFDDKWEDEWLQGCRVVQAILSGKSNPAQEQGSALTYARRYSLLMAFGLATEDDDAESLTKTQPKLTISQKMVDSLTEAIRNKGYMKSYVEDVLSKYGCKTLNDIHPNDLPNIKKDLEI